MPKIIVDKYSARDISVIGTIIFCGDHSSKNRDMGNDEHMHIGWMAISTCGTHSVYIQEIQN